MHRPPDGGQPPPDPAPLASGDPSPQFTVLFPPLLVCSAPPAALTALAVFSGDRNIVWVAIAVGAVEGPLLGWGLGRLGHRRLETRGPELLDTLRWGWDTTAGRSAEPAAGENPGNDANAGSEDTEEWALFTRLERNLDTLSGREPVGAPEGTTAPGTRSRSREDRSRGQASRIAVPKSS